MFGEDMSIKSNKHGIIRFKEQFADDRVTPFKIGAPYALAFNWKSG